LLTVPEPVAQRSSTADRAVAPEEWRRWHSVPRYALYKTALSKNDSAAFFALLVELRESEVDARQP
jgi:hypothetical protein